LQEGRIGDLVTHSFSMPPPTGAVLPVKVSLVTVVPLKLYMPPPPTVAALPVNVSLIAVTWAFKLPSLSMPPPVPLRMFR